MTSGGLDRVVVINDFSVAFGGATALALLSAQELAKKGVPVAYLAGDGGDNPLFAALGIAATGLGQKPLLEARALLRGLYNFDAEKMLGRWIEKFDSARTVYHLHNWAHILSPAIFRPLKSVKGRVFLSAHDFFLTCPNGGYMNYPKVKPCALTPLTGACLASNCDKRNYAHKCWRVLRQMVRVSTYDVREQSPTVLVIHPGMNPYLERGGVPSSNIEVLLNPVTPFSDRRIPAEANTEILYVGRLDYEKGADIAAAAARKAGVALRIIGDGPLRPQLEAIYPDVTFAGRLPKDAIAKLVPTAAALVMPTRYPEPFGLVAVEALWSGLPVLLPRTSFLAADVAAKGAGILFDIDDEQSLVQAMREISADADLRKRMSMIGYGEMRDLANTQDAWVERLYEFYRDAVASH